eukprot:Hpha_TRINITY_DN15697_c1_g8::TRINITY_DN15697_c1_g8_i1::g.98859::m.98859
MMGGRGRGAPPPPGFIPQAHHHHHGKGGWNRPSAPPPPPQQSLQDSALLPFAGSGGSRTPSEHIGRAPHRFLSCYDESLSSVNPAWTSKTPGHIAEEITQHVPMGVMVPENGRVDPVDVSEDGTIDVRAFLTGGISAGRGHVLSRIQVAGGNRRKEGGRGGTFSAYGGKVKCKTEKQQVTALKKMLKAQAGVDLGGVKTWDRLVQFHYSDGRQTVFYVPNLSEASVGSEGLQLKAQSVEKSEEVEKDEEYESEEEVEVEVPKKEEPAAKEEAAEEEAVKEESAEAGEKKEEETEKRIEKRKIVKTRKVMKTEKSYTTTVAPDIQTIASLRQQRPDAETERENAEFCQAVDAFDEWIQRDFGLELISVLKQKGVEEEVRRKEQEVVREKALERKRKRNEVQEDNKKRRLEKESVLREEWKVEDEGLTEEDRKKVMPERNGKLQKIKEEMEQELKDKYAEMEVDGPAPTPTARTKVVYEREEKNFQLFQIFDRPRGALTSAASSLDREYLARQLLCAQSPEVSTLRQALQLTTLGDISLGTRRPLNYAYLCQNKKIVKEEQPEKKEEKPAELRLPLPKQEDCERGAA